MASQTIKRQRRRKRIDTDGDPEFQVAPMVDVLLVLTLFFMSITSTEVLKKDKNLALADAKNAKKADQKDKKNEIVVNVGWNAANSTGEFSMDGINYPSADALQNVIAGQHAKNPAAYVLIRADRSVEYSCISDLMNTCATVGIGTVTFAVIIGGGDTNQKAPDAGAGVPASN